MKKKYLLTLTIALFTLVTCKAQILIGYTKEDIINYISKNEPSYILTGDKKGVGLFYKINNGEELGRIYLLQEHDICYSYQIAFDYKMLNTVISDLNSMFVKENDHEWLDHTEKLTYKLNLIREPAFFIIQRSIHKVNSIK